MRATASPQLDTIAKPIHAPHRPRLRRTTPGNENTDAAGLLAPPNATTWLGRRIAHCHVATIKNMPPYPYARLLLVHRQALEL